MATTVEFIVAPEIAEGAASGVVLGDFNNWNPEYAISLEQQQDGSLKAIANLEAGRTYQYRYLLSDGRWVNDGRAEEYVPANGFFVDNCVITVRDEEVKPAEIIENTFIPATTPEVANEDVSAVTEPIAKTRTKKAAAKPKAKAATKETDAPKDDLTSIEGINKKVAAVLAAEGITTYKALAKTTGKKLKTILVAAGDKFAQIDSSNWTKEAKKMN